MQSVNLVNRLIVRTYYKSIPKDGSSTLYQGTFRGLQFAHSKIPIFTLRNLLTLRSLIFSCLFFLKAHSIFFFRTN